jgi:hypothetical protein
MHTVYKVYKVYILSLYTMDPPFKGGSYIYTTL